MEWREKELLAVLKNKTLKTVDIIDRVNMSKTTTLKYLDILRARGLIDYEAVGPTKLWSRTEVREEIRAETSEKTMPVELERYIYVDKRVLKMLEEFERNTGIELNIVVDKNGIGVTFKEYRRMDGVLRSGIGGLDEFIKVIEGTLEKYRKGELKPTEKAT